MRTSVHNAPWFNFWFQRYVYIYIVCLFISYASHLSFSSLFHYLSPPLLIFSFENRPALFRYRKRQLNLASVFCLFCVVVHFFWLVNACFCCVRFSFFHTKPSDWLVETSPKWPTLCRVRHKTTTQSIYRSISRNRQVAPVSNTWLLWLTRVCWWLDQISRICRAHTRDQHTDRHTENHATCFVMHH